MIYVLHKFDVNIYVTETRQPCGFYHKNIKNIKNFPQGSYRENIFLRKKIFTRKNIYFFLHRVCKKIYVFMFCFHNSSNTAGCS